MLPPVVAVYGKDIIEDHRAEPQHNEFPDAPYVKCGIEPVCLESLPSGPVFIAEGREGISQNVAQKSQFEALVQSIGCQDNFIVSCKEQNLAALRLNVELEN